MKILKIKTFYLRNLAHRLLPRNIAIQIFAKSARFKHWLGVVFYELRDKWYGIEVYQRGENGECIKKKYSK